MGQSLTGEQKTKTIVAAAFIIPLLLSALYIAWFISVAGEGHPASPTAAFEFTYNESADVLTITHNAGDRIVASDLLITVTSKTGAPIVERRAWNSETLNGEANYTVDGAPAVGEGDSVRVSNATAGAVPASYNVRVIYQIGEGSSQTLATHPD